MLIYIYCMHKHEIIIDVPCSTDDAIIYADACHAGASGGYKLKFCGIHALALSMFIHYKRCPIYHLSVIESS